MAGVCAVLFLDYFSRYRPAIPKVHYSDKKWG